MRAMGQLQIGRQNGPRTPSCERSEAETDMRCPLAFAFFIIFCSCGNFSSSSFFPLRIPAFMVATSDRLLSFFAASTFCGSGKPVQHGGLGSWHGPL